MAYTAELRTQSKDGMVRTVLGSFDEPALKELWHEMGLGQNDWASWHDALRSGQEYILLPDFPEISRIASADEGITTFRDQALRELHEECQRACKTVYGPGAQSILTLLLDGANLALESHGYLIVHPF